MVFMTGQGGVGVPLDLVEAASTFRAGRCSVDELLAAVRVATFVAAAPATPGLLVFSAQDGSDWTAVFSSMEALARHLSSRGQGQQDVSYLQADGADLLDNLLPAGVGLLIDPGGDHSVVLPASWL